MSNKKTTAYFVIGALSLIMIILLVTPMVHAAPAPSSEPVEASIQEFPIAASIETNYTDHNTNADSNLENLSIEEKTLQEVVSYKEKFEAYAMQPGWILVKYDQYDILPTTGPKPLPAKHQRETWSHFDESRQVFEEVEYATAPEFGTVLLGYFDNGKLVSVWHNESFLQLPYTPSYDFYLSEVVKGLMEGNAEFEINSSTEISDKKVTIVELKIAYSEQELKWIDIKFDQSVWGVLERYYFDADTGMLLRYEHNYLMNDKSIVPVSITDNFEFIINSQPTTEVLRLVEGE